jgi:hypothetical protein
MLDFYAKYALNSSSDISSFSIRSLLIFSCNSLFSLISLIAVLYAFFNTSFTFSSIFLVVSSEIKAFVHCHEYESISHIKFSAQISSNIQNLVTIFLAILVALSISLLAQVVIFSFQKNISSAALHQ